MDHVLINTLCDFTRVFLLKIKHPFCEVGVGREKWGWNELLPVMGRPQGVSNGPFLTTSEHFHLIFLIYWAHIQPLVVGICSLVYALLMIMLWFGYVDYKIFGISLMDSMLEFIWKVAQLLSRQHYIIMIIVTVYLEHIVLSSGSNSTTNRWS